MQTLRSGLKNEAQAGFFNQLGSVLCLMKHCLWLLKALIIVGEIQSKSSLIFLIIKITYPNQCYRDHDPHVESLRFFFTVHLYRNIGQNYEFI